MPPSHYQQIGNVTNTNGTAYVGIFNVERSGESEEDRRSRVLNALRSKDPLDDRGELLIRKGELTPGTCEWIREDSRYQDWLHGTSNRLWISGDPGRGKTMLSIFITHDIEGRLEQGRDEGILTHHFCRYADDTRSTEISILWGFLVRVLRNVSSETFNQAIWSDLEILESNDPSSWDVGRVWECLKRIIMTTTSPVLCLLDGLDECDKGVSKHLLQRFDTLFTPPALAFRLVVVSRSSPTYLGFSHIELGDDNTRTRNDVDLFISRIIQTNFSGREDFDGRSLWMLQSAVLKLSEGSFIWAGYVLNELSEIPDPTPTQLLEELGDIPRDLELVYRRILDQVLASTQKHREHITAILTWVMLAFTPLTVTQLACAIPQQSERDVRDLLKRCKQLLHIHRGTQTVTFIHASVTQFLQQLSTGHSLDSHPDWTLAEDGHLRIARRCLTILKTGDDESPLTGYAIENWSKHLNACSHAEVIEALSDRFFEAENLLNQWHRWQRQRGWDPLSKNKAAPTTLHLACYWGVVTWAKQLIQESRLTTVTSWEIYTASTSGATPLCLAASLRKWDILELLLENGAPVSLDIAARGKPEYLNTPLRHVTEHKRFAMVLKYVQDIDWLSVRRSHDLARAYLENPGLAHLLVGRFPVPASHRRDTFECPALVRAAQGAKLAVVQQLLEVGADVESQSGSRDALFAACCEYQPFYPYLGVVTALLDWHDLTNSSKPAGDKQPWPCRSLGPLEHCDDRYELTRHPQIEATIKRLLGLEGRVHAFFAAVACSQTEVVDLLLDRGVGKYIESGYSGRAELYCAVWQRHTEVVEILLRRRVSPDFPADDSGTSMMRQAAQWGSCGPLLQILGKDADVDFPDGDITAALMELLRAVICSPDVIYRTHLLDRHHRSETLECIEALLRRGADTQAAGLAGETAQSLADSIGDQEILHILENARLGIYAVD